MIYIFWFILSVVCGSIGSGRKIGFFGAFIVAILLSPLIGFIVALSSKRLEDIRYQEEVQNFINQQKGVQTNQSKEKEDIQARPLEYNDEDLFPNDRIHPLFVQTARVIAEFQICNYSFLHQKLGIRPDRASEIMPQLIKYGVIAPKEKKDAYWKVLVRNEVQLEELIEFHKNKK